MELKDYLDIFGRRRWIIFFTAFFTFVVVLIGVTQTPPKYTAITKIRVLTTRVGSKDNVDYNVGYAQRLIGTYVEMAKSGPVIDELSKYVDTLPKIDAKVVLDTELIQISAEDEDPARAQFAVNKLAQLLVAESKKLYSEDVNPVSIYVVESAEIPQIPSSTSPFVVIGLGIAIGIIGGLGVALLFEALDTRLYSPKQIEAFTQLPLLGDIPDDPDRQPEDGLFEDSPLHIESFGRLRTNLFSQIDKKEISTLLIASPVAQDGRSVITANLALSIAQANHTVVVVDANLRWPTIHKLYSLDNKQGLSDFLQQRSKLSDIVHPTKYPGIHVITSGPLPPNPVELLSSDQMKLAIAQLKQQFDVILVDSPASLTVTDPAVIAPVVDGVLLVIRQGWVRREVAQSTLKNLFNVNANLIGVIVNRTAERTSSRFSKQRSVRGTKSTGLPGADGGNTIRENTITDIEDKISNLNSKLDILMHTLAKPQTDGTPAVSQEKIFETTKSLPPEAKKQINPAEEDLSKKLDDLLNSLKK